MENVEIISEIGSIHDGSFGNAVCAIRASKFIGCDTVKFQFHIAEEETTHYAKSPAYFKGEDRFSYFQRTGFSEEQWRSLRKEAIDNDINFLVSPFSIKSVDILESIGVDYFKIASGEVTNLPLIERLNKPNFKVILSSGMSDWNEIQQAVKLLNAVNQLTILQCTSEYPCPLDKVGLNLINEIQDTINPDRVGLSDHSEGFSAAIGAVYHGAKVIEKHFSFSKLMYGSDAQFGQTPEEMGTLVRLVREAEQLVKGKIKKEIDPGLRAMKAVFEKSIVSKFNLSAGTTLSEDLLALKKPGDGLPAKALLEVVGKTLKTDIKADQQIMFGDLDD